MLRLDADNNIVLSRVSSRGHFHSIRIARADLIAVFDAISGLLAE